MRFNQLLAACGLSFLTVVSCVEKENLHDAENEVEFAAEIENPIPFHEDTDTKTYIDENDAYATGVGTMWRKKEQIGVYSSYSKNAKFISTNGANAGSVSFSGICLGTPQYSYYPYSSNNKNVSATAVKGNLPASQSYDYTTKDIVGDYRAGVLESRNWLSSTFTFKRLVTILRFLVNAADTPLENSQIESLSIKVSNKRQISGDFTINLHTQTISQSSFVEGNDNLTLTWDKKVRLEPGVTTVAYMTALPVVQPGDVLTFTIKTDTHIATFTRTAKTAHTPNALIKFTINLASAENLQITSLQGSTEKPETPDAAGVHPVLKSMKFTVADNPGKILPGQVEYVSSSKKTSYSANKRTEEVCAVDTVNHKITAYIPYLGNRKLVPTFEIPEGTKLYYEGGEIISGETEVDFAKFKQLAVVNAADEGVVYDVELANTGLPVVVVNQISGLTPTSDGFWEAATGTQTQAKDSDWSMSEGDSFMVYNPDGTSALIDKSGATVETPVLSSTRLRGNVSQKMPKKPFAVKLDGKHGMLGMPAHKRWVLLANWSDRTLMRNAIAYDVADIFKQTFPNDGLKWNPSGQFVELVYNGVYVGNYYLCEQIKIDGNRLDINDPYEEGAVADASAYGYLLECDDAYDEPEGNIFMSKHYIPFMIKDDVDPDGKVLQYAKDIVYGVEENLYAGKYEAAYDKLDITSVVDFLLIQELMMNGEMAHPKSCYMYIDNGRLYAGPIWDFDWQTIPNVTVIEQYYDNSYTGGSNTYNYTYTKSMMADAVHYRKSGSGYPSKPYESSSWFSTSTDKNYMWYPMLVKDATFKAKAAERWNAVSGALSAYADIQIPAIAAKIKLSEAENWSMWKLESGSSAAQQRWSTYDVGGGFKGDEAMTFENAVSTLTTNMNKRINGMSYVTNQSWPSISIKSSTK